MTCRYADWDGSYVLGGLPTRERLEYEQHLVTCAGCAADVRALAGLPGLLAQVDPSVLETSAADMPAPTTLLPALVHQAERRRRRRVLATVGVAAAAAAVAVGVPLALTPGRDPAPRAVPTAATTATPTGRPMVVVAGAPLRADLLLNPVAWGTRLDLTCTYTPDSAAYGNAASGTYVLFVRTRDGGSEQVGTWRALQGATMRVTAATAASPAEITSVEVRTADGRPVLQLTT